MTTMEIRPRVVPIMAIVLRFLRLRAMPKIPKIKEAMARKNDRMFTIGIQEPRSARVPKMMARILRFSVLFASFVNYSFLVNWICVRVR